MKVALVLCPAWSIDMPHLALGLLSSNLRKEGREVAVFDLNVKLYHQCKEHYKVLWRKENDSRWGMPGRDGEDTVPMFIQEHEEIVDYYVGRILNTGASIIGLSVYYTTERMSLEIARRIKARDGSRVIVFGGPQCFMSYRKMIAYEFVDAVAIGEGDLTICALVSAIEKGEDISGCAGVITKKNVRSDVSRDPCVVDDLDALPPADFSDFVPAEYLFPNSLPVLFSRGCIKRCVFCTGHGFWGRYRCGSGSKLFNDISYHMGQYPDVRSFQFYDLLVNGDLRALEDFCDLAIGALGKGYLRRFNWSAQAVVRPDMGAELWKKLRQAGCTHMALGIESGSQKVVNDMGKRFRIEDADKNLRYAREAGIRISTNFMFGFPTESRDDFSDTLEFLRRNKDFIDEVLPSESFCSIDKGTYLYGHAEEFGILSGSDSIFWEAGEGANNLPERIRRFEEFCLAAKSLGIDVPASVEEKVGSNKELWLRAYQMQKEQR
ncbi:MAG: radical SAM protein [Candidatus Omnitrophica bacterium]|nr:radical SAM protein [Candidatus Omnitrophota bacterium]